MDQNQIKIKEIKKKSGRYQVTFEKEDEIDSVLLDEEQLVRERIIPEKIYSISEWDEIINSSNLYFGVKQAIKYLSFKARATSEVKTYLKEHDYQSETIDQIIEKLNEMHMLDDERFVSDYIDSYRHNLKGPILIRYQLEQKEIDRHLILQKLSSYTEQEELTNINTIIEKERNRLNTYPISKQKELITQKLTRDGFTPSLIFQAMAKVEFESDHLDRMQKEFSKLKSQENDKAKIMQKMLQKGYNYQEIKNLLEK